MSDLKQLSDNELIRMANRQNLEDMLAQMPDVNPYGEIEWGRPVGKEVW